MHVKCFMCEYRILNWKKKEGGGESNDPYPYNGLMLHGKNATENTNWEAEGDKLRLSLSW